MSEEELGEGGLGLRARGGGRTVGHGQVLVQGSEGTEEVVEEEEEAPEDEDEVQALLLQLLDRDLLACDVQLSLFVAAASSYRQVALPCFYCRQFVLVMHILSRTQHFDHFLLSS